MENFKVIYGDLFEGIFNGQFDITLQGVNCFNTQGAGIVIPFKKHFNTDKFPMEQIGKGDVNKLGQIDGVKFVISPKGIALKYGSPESNEGKLENGFYLTVYNCYSQYHYGMNHIDGTDTPIDYEALSLCLRKINFKHKGKRIGLPLIGGGLAGGDPIVIENIMRKELKDCDVTLVLFEK